MCEVTIKKQKCLRCEYKWFPKPIDGKFVKPLVCPKCKSPYWDKIKKQFKKGDGK